jgi:hypothetical protein
MIPDIGVIDSNVISLWLEIEHGFKIYLAYIEPYLSIKMTA